MAEISLLQSEADALIAMEKHRVDEQKWDYPVIKAISIPLVSANKREDFLLDIRRSRIDLVKGSYQNRSRQVVILVRLDLGSKPHRNPDGNSISSPHLHIYHEGYGDKWAVSALENGFQNTTDLWRTLTDFMKYCNITKPPHIEKGLFL